jgi:hypothetical protein
MVGEADNPVCHSGSETLENVDVVRNIPLFAFFFDNAPAN